MKDQIGVLKKKEKTGLSLQKPTLFLLSIGLILISLFFLSLSLKVEEDSKVVFEGDFFDSLELCNSEPELFRFSCYLSALGKYYGGDFEGLLNLLEEDERLSLEKTFHYEEGDVSYSVFGANCHTFYHSLGDFIAMEGDSESISELYNYCPTTCTGGCMMGVFKRTALKEGFTTEILSELYESCREEEKNQCAHEIGHLLQDKYFSSILKPLDQTAKSRYGFDLYDINFQYTTFDTVNFELPFEECREILPRDKWENCYSGVGHNMYAFSFVSGSSYASEIKNCEKINNRDSKLLCLQNLMLRIGMNDASPKFLSNRFQDSIAVCEEVSSMVERDSKLVKDSCLLGIGGGIGLFVESTISKEVPDDERIYNQRRNFLLSYAKLCDEAEEYSFQCFSGLVRTSFPDYYEAFNLSYEGYDKVWNLFDVPPVRFISDQALKTDFESITSEGLSALERVSGLNGMFFRWNDLYNSLFLSGNKSKFKQFGLIAQEVEEVLPEAVSSVNMRGVTYKTVDYIKIIPLLVEAIKEQQGIIEKQQSQINQLREVLE